MSGLPEKHDLTETNLPEEMPDIVIESSPDLEVNLSPNSVSPEPLDRIAISLESTTHFSSPETTARTPTGNVSLTTSTSESTAVSSTKSLTMTSLTTATVSMTGPTARGEAADSHPRSGYGNRVECSAMTNQTSSADTPTTSSSTHDSLTSCESHPTSDDNGINAKLVQSNSSSKYDQCLSSKRGPSPPKCTEGSQTGVNSSISPSCAPCKSTGPIWKAIDDFPPVTAALPPTGTSISERTAVSTSTTSSSLSSSTSATDTITGPTARGEAANTYPRSCYDHRVECPATTNQTSSADTPIASSSTHDFWMPSGSHPTGGNDVKVKPVQPNSSSKHDQCLSSKSGPPPKTCSSTEGCQTGVNSSNSPSFASCKNTGLIRKATSILPPGTTALASTGTCISESTAASTSTTSSAVTSSTSATDSMTGSTGRGEAAFNQSRSRSGDHIGGPATTNQTSSSYAPPASSSARPTLYASGGFPNSSLQPQRWRQHLANMHRLDVPMFPNMSLCEERRQTFPDWRPPGFPCADQLALAGFFYLDPPDKVQCFHCGCRLRDWSRGTNAFIEHILNSPDCEYVRQLMEPEFIQAVNALRNCRFTLTWRMVQEYRQRRQSNNVCEVHVEAICEVKLLVQQGYSKEHVYRAARLLRIEGKGLSRYNIINELRQMNIVGGGDLSQRQEPNTAELAAEAENLRNLRTENARLQNKLTCRVCFTRPVKVVFLPCGHLICCQGCAEVMLSCPLCWVAIQSRVQVHFA